MILTGADCARRYVRGRGFDKAQPERAVIQLGENRPWRDGKDPMNLDTLRDNLEERNIILNPPALRSHGQPHF
jgi:hypothetical protein